jgi:all-trans-retinol 13,14-reductase
LAKDGKYWDKKGKEDQDYDVIVIGSGMGGMTAAAMLAKWGNKVLVLEQHYVPGGYTHTFRRKKWTWDVGVHAVGEVTEKSLPGRILKRLTDGRLEWASLGPHYEEFNFPDGVRIDFPDNKHQFRENLVAAFPDDVTAIDRYLELTSEVSRTMRGYYMAKAAPPGLRRATHFMMARPAEKWLAKTTLEVTEELTDNPKLRAVFAAQWGYLGSVPSRCSFAMQALVVRHFIHGAYYPIGGSGQIATHLLKTVADAGGWTRIYADVEEIIIENGAAVGVRLSNDEEIRAPRIVSAAGVQSTVKRLLPKEALGSWSESVDALRPASAHVCLYLGFEGDIREHGAGGANQWFWNSWDPELDVWDVTQEPLDNAPILYCSYPSLKDPLHEAGPDHVHTGEIVTFVPWETFEPFQGTRWKRRGAEYEALKKRIHDSLLEQYFRHNPGLKPLLKYSELSTPVTSDHFVRPVSGSIYGIEPTPERFAADGLRPRSPIPGLYFAGSEVSAVGVIGAMMGGVLAAAAMEPRRAMGWLRSV